MKSVAKSDLVSDRIKMPKKLLDTFHEIVKLFLSGKLEYYVANNKREILYKDFLFPEIVGIDTSRRKEHPDMGQQINVYFIESRFSPRIREVRKVSKSVYQIMTGSSSMWFVETRNDGWKLFKYRDKPIV